MKMGFKGRKQRTLIEYNFRGSINSIRFAEYMVEGVGLKNIEWGGTASFKKKKSLFCWGDEHCGTACTEG